MQYLKQILVILILLITGQTHSQEYHNNLIGNTKADLYNYIYFLQDIPNVHIIEKKDTIILDFNNVDIVCIFNSGVVVKQIKVYICNNNMAMEGDINSPSYSWSNEEENNKYKYSISIKGCLTFVIIELNNKNNN